MTKKIYGSSGSAVDLYAQKLTVECPKCNGYGDGCFQCSGWGRVEPGCIHEWKELSVKECREKNITHWGMCWHQYQCNHCGKLMSQDSSD
jgi:hypothetical protein